MGEVTKIQWTDHTFNPWWGCVKVSEGCKNCYAETFSKRTGNNVWGADAERRFFGDKHWAEPLKWERVAKEAGKPAFVFCASMADVFEDRADLAPQRARLFALVRDTPNLVWLLLTKRPENADRLWGKAQYDAFDGSESLGPMWARNVWLGTTAENQGAADDRLRHLAMSHATVRFVSAEPLLERLDLRRWLLRGWVDWVIIGGESGPKSRPFDMDWARDLISQCRAAGASPFFKQAGKRPFDGLWTLRGHDHPTEPKYLRLNDAKGGDLSELPPEFHVRERPEARP